MCEMESYLRAMNLSVATDDELVRWNADIMARRTALTSAKACTWGLAFTASCLSTLPQQF